MTELWNKIRLLELVRVLLCQLEGIRGVSLLCFVTELKERNRTRNLPHEKEIPQVPKGSAPVLVKRMLGCAALEVAIRPGSIGSDWAKQ